MSALLAPFISLFVLLGIFEPATQASILWNAIEIRAIPSVVAATSSPASKSESPSVGSKQITKGTPTSAAASTRVPVAKSAQPSAQPTQTQPAQQAQPQQPVSSKPGSGAPSTLEIAVVSALNAARAESGLAPLQSDGALTAIARAHSADMLGSGYFSHTNLSGCSASCRYEKAGYAYWSMAENIYWMEGYTLTTAEAALKVVESWQNSAGHRKNNLGDFTRVGIGIAQSGSKVYVTANFSTPR